MTRARRLATAVWGSTATAVVRAGAGPVMLVGPAAERPPSEGPVLVPLDGSRPGEAVLGLAADWARATGARLELRQVLDPATVQALVADARTDVVEGAYLTRVAHDIAGVEVNWDVLHAEDPASAIVDAAAAVGAGVVAMATHGPALAIAGSVALGVVHDAGCPVVVVRPPGLAG